MGLLSQAVAFPATHHPNLLPTTATPREYHKLGKNLRPKSTLPAGMRQKQDLKVVFCPASQNPGWASVRPLKYLCFVTTLRSPHGDRDLAMH